MTSYAILLSSHVPLSGSALSVPSVRSVQSVKVRGSGALRQGHAYAREIHPPLHIYPTPILRYLFFFIERYGASGASSEKAGQTAGSPVAPDWRRKVGSCWKMFPDRYGAAGALVQYFSHCGKMF